jgi:hypothetical protein
MKMSQTILIVAAVGGGLYYLSKRKAPSSAGTGGATVGGPTGDGSPNMEADGFVLTDDCRHMLLDPNGKGKGGKTSKAFYDYNTLHGGPQYTSGPQAADAHTRAFFNHYYQGTRCASVARQGSAIQSDRVITGPWEDVAVLPTKAPAAQQAMYIMMALVFAGYLVEGGRWTDETGMEWLGKLAEMVDATALTQAQLDEIFGTAPVALKQALGLRLAVT